MSLIEKAIDKLNKKKEEDAQRGGADTSADRFEALEQAAQQDSVEASAAAATDTEPAQQQPGKQRADTAGQTVTLNQSKMKMAGMLTADAGRSRIAEEYRLIKRPILTNAAGKGATVVPNANLIMVTSALPGEGKTFCAINLAMSIAMELDKTVLLVDADVARPSISRTLGIETGAGLIDVLVDRNIELGDVLVRTDVSKLTLLPAGRSHRYSTELLASGEMERLTREISQRYTDRIVIFDSPPLLHTSEASVLANLMGQVIMVVEAERTPQYAVKEALTMLDGPEIIGFILNKTRHTTSGGYYYYGYGTY